MGPHRKRVFSLKDFCLCNHEASLEMPAERYKHNAVRISVGKLLSKGRRRKKTFVENLWRSWYSCWGTRAEENLDWQWGRWAF